jgi:hypothetical protein
MKRLLLLGLLLAAAGGLLWSQSFTVVLQNAEDTAFYYVVDPPELIVFDTATSIFENVVFDYFAEEPANGDDFAGFSELAPGESMSLDGLTEGKHLLVGFFVVPGKIGFPVRVITLQAGGGLDERTYRIFDEPALITARAGRGRISDYPPVPLAAVAQPAAPSAASAAVPSTAPSAAPATAPQAAEPAERPAEAEAPAAAAPATTAAAEPAAPASAAPKAAAAPVEERGFFRFKIDNQYEDWEAIPAFLSFPPDRPLTSFTREQYGGEFEVLPIAQSKHWGKEGTAINEIKVVNNLESIYLYVSTYSTISSNMSIFLYFQTEQNLRRRGATNRLTLELLPAKAEEPGLVVLWEKGREPMIVGKLDSGSFFLEAEINKDLLYDIEMAKPAITFFDLTTSYFDRQELDYEEFYVASVPLSRIPTENTLY